MTAGILAIVSGATGAELVLPMGIIDVFLVASVALGIKGSRQEGLAKRFRRYQQVIGERTFCLIEELSAAIGKKPKFVQKDLRKMIRDGFFPQGYLDKKETCLITDQQTYQQYLQTEKAYEARTQEAQADGRKAGRSRRLLPPLHRMGANIRSCLPRARAISGISIHVTIRSRIRSSLKN